MIHETDGHKMWQNLAGVDNAGMLDEKEKTIANRIVAGSNK